MIHELKIHPEYFDATLHELKTFELRRADRPFHVGDTLCLREFDPETFSYSGRILNRVVTYLMDPAAIDSKAFHWNEFALMSIRTVSS